MIKVKIYNTKAEPVGEIKLADDVFGVKEKGALIHQAFVAQMANERQVLAHTKDRSEVSGGGKKPWRQKGTGRARAGSSRSPIWRGGGVTFGPLKNRNFSKKINKKMKKKAILMALSSKVANNNFVILDKLEINEFKTKLFLKIVDNFKNILNNKEKIIKVKDNDKNNQGQAKAKGRRKYSVLIINDKLDAKIKYSSRNIAGIKTISLNNINIVDLLKYKNLILTLAGVKKIEDINKIN